MAGSGNFSYINHFKGYELADQCESLLDMTYHHLKIRYCMELLMLGPICLHPTCLYSGELGVALDHPFEILWV